MGYGTSNRVLMRMVSHLDEIMLNDKPSWTFPDSTEANTFAYALRNALNYARKHQVDPYSKLSVTVSSKLNKVEVIKHKGWRVISRSDNQSQLLPEIDSLTSFILLKSSLTGSQFKLPNLVIEPDEEDLFQDLLDSKNLILIQRNPIIIKNGS